MSAVLANAVAMSATAAKRNLIADVFMNGKTFYSRKAVCARAYPTDSDTSRGFQLRAAFTNSRKMAFEGSSAA